MLLSKIQHTVYYVIAVIFIVVVIVIVIVFIPIGELYTVRGDLQLVEELWGHSGLVGFCAEHCGLVGKTPRYPYSSCWTGPLE